MSGMAEQGTGVHALESVLATLADALPDLAEQTVARIRGELDSYAAISSEALTAAVDRNLVTAMRALRSGAVPAPDRLHGAAQTARERFEAGIPVEEIVRGFRISIALIHERFVDLAVTEKLPAAATVDGVRVMWGVADAFTTRIITEYHDLEVGAALRDAQRRISSVRALLAGAEPDEVSLAALDASATYAAVHADVPDGSRGEAIRKTLEESGSTESTRAFVVLDGTHCFGILAKRPADPEVSVGIGPFVDLGDLPRSDREARQCLRVAQQAGRTGVQGLAELGWRLAAADRPDVGALYAAAFLAPLEAEGEFGADVRAAVTAWLRNTRSIPRAAEALTVHPNTVRYRLTRFAELTGFVQEDPDHLMGAYWAFELDPVVDPHNETASRVEAGP